MRLMIKEDVAKMEEQARGFSKYVFILDLTTVRLERSENICPHLLYCLLAMIFKIKTFNLYTSRKYSSLLRTSHFFKLKIHTYKTIHTTILIMTAS